MNAHRKTARSRILKALAVALAASGVSGAARAAEGEFMRDILGSIGLIEKERPPIQYRERAPLVLPPRSDLPQPVARGAVNQSVAWPKDPEVVARARQAARDKETRKVTATGWGDDSAKLSIYEMRQGRRPGAGIQTEENFEPKKTDREETVLSVFELLKGKKDDVEVASMEEPDRALLSDPPAGYRRPPGGAERGRRANNAMPSDYDVVNPLQFHRQQAER